ncbi:response regulator [Heliorestis acidaminivorans]|uniref:Stage 0 sporulation protein A homolog n=1 Tax=Heliorestis acidaminivorans TaxID=553427 RepID=A0A6I0F4X2_9FIRM|nr:response regulator [Heliorestis acidaminivorans]KAB2954563.1 response regulator [Heliorestis acidaminivorans]
MKILIVDDSQVYRTQLVRFLKELLPEAEYITAGDGVEGYYTYLRESPDFVLLDLLMPGMTGQEVLKKIKEEDPYQPVIILTADVQKFVKDEVMALGALTFLQKPITREKIAEVVKIIKGVA